MGAMIRCPQSFGNMAWMCINKPSTLLWYWVYKGKLMASGINVTLAQIITLCFILEAQWLEQADNAEWSDALKKEKSAVEEKQNRFIYYLQRMRISAQCTGSCLLFSFNDLCQIRQFWASYPSIYSNFFVHSFAWGSALNIFWDLDGRSCSIAFHFK